MSYIGLRKPFVAKLDMATNTYSNGFQYSHAVSVNVDPQYVEASLFGDDEQVEYEKSFKNATVSLGTTNTPVQAASTVFGHTVNQGEVIYKSTDIANYVGLGVIAPERIDGTTKYVALILFAVKFSDPPEALTTKGENLQFNTPTIQGVAISNGEGNWKKTNTFDTETEAITYIKGVLNIE